MADLLVNNPNWQNFAASLEKDRGLAPGLLKAVLNVETAGGHPDIIGKTSSAGAQGAYQFMPATAKQYNVNVNDTADSTRGAADYLGDLTKKYGDPILASAAYNWGPGNLDRAISAASANKLPTDALSLASNGFLPKETSAYVVKVASGLQPQAQDTAALPLSQVAGTTQNQGITPYPPEVIKQTKQAVIDQLRQGAAPTSIVNQLQKSPVGDMVSALLQQGTSPEDIITQIGGKELAAVKQIQAKVGQQGFVTNLGQGVSSGLEDLGNAEHQLVNRVTGNDAELKAWQQSALAKQNDPTVQAQSDTVGGMIGSGSVKALPYIAAGLATRGTATLPMLMLSQGGAGAVSGALTPTTGDNQIVNNVLTEGALGAGTAGLAKGAGGAFTKAINGVTNPAGAAERQALIAAAEKQGLPVTPMNVSNFWRQVGDAMPKNASVQGARDAADAAVTGKIAEGVGLPGWTGKIDSDLVNKASLPIKAALDDATNVSVVLPQSLKSDLSGIVAAGTNPLTEGIADSGIVTKAVANLGKAIDTGAPVSGAALQGLNSELKDLLHNPSISNSQKQIAAKLITKINDSLTSAMTPEQQAAYATANRQYTNLKAIERMVRSSNDTGVVSPRQVLQAAKTGAFKNAFVKGEAPYQELGSTAAELYGPANGRGLGDVIAKAAGGHDEAFGAASILEPTVGLPAWAAKYAGSKILGKLAASQNPAVVRLLTGTSGKAIDPAMATYLAKAVSGGVGASR